jgi:acetate kinase
MILVLNCGSQSIKWKVYDTNLKLAKEGRRVVVGQETFEKFLREEIGHISSMGITKIGHRVVHGKDIFLEPTQIDEKNIKALEVLNNLAPLHNPYNTLGIKVCQEIFPETPQIAVFDTEFFASLSEAAFTYALPRHIADESGFRRYGFHGISHEYVAKEAAKQLKNDPKGAPEKLKIITCHLGGGSSVAAIKDGVAVDTSMGFTPMQGLVMMTRSGDMDPGVILELCKKFGVEKAEEILNKESGIKGICGDEDMLSVLSKIKAGDAAAKLAFDVFIYSIQKYIGAYFAILGGCDVLVFTGSIGEGDPVTRESICKNLGILSAKGGPASGWKKTKILAIKTDEELAIAQKIVSY